MRPEPRLRQHLLFRQIAEEGLLLDLETDLGYSVNRVGARVLSLLREGVRGDEIPTRLVEEFDIDEGRCAAEIEAFFETLEAAGLLERD